MGDMPHSSLPTILNVYFRLPADSTRYLPCWSHVTSSNEMSDVSIGLSISAAMYIS